MSQYALILCDDRPEKYSALVDFLGGKEFEVEHVESVSELCGCLSRSQRYCAVFLDLYFPDSDGNRTILSVSEVESVRRSAPSSKLIIYTAFSDEKTHSLMRSLIGRRIVDYWLDKDELKSKREKTRIEVMDVIGVRDYIAESDGLWMLHISDLHFGKTLIERGKKVLGGPACGDSST